MKLLIDTNIIVDVALDRDPFTLEEILAEICDDEGLRGKLKEYTNNLGSASLLNSIIGSLVTVAALHGIPIDGAIATIFALYILKIGLSVFCKYTGLESEGDKK